MTTTVIQPPVFRKRFLVFDVETSGLLPNNRRGASCQAVPIEQYPHILQLSFAIYDIADKKVVRQFDSYVRIPESIEIPPIVQDLTGITKDMCQTQGRDILYVLEQFYEAYMFCDGLVAHNMDFDEKMIMVEIERNRPILMEKAPHCFMTFNTMYEKVHGIERFCTMRKGTDMCNILVESKLPGRPPSKKWPKLNELYAKLFDGEQVDGLHNSMVDVLVCLRCYLKMRHNIDDVAFLQKKN